MDDQMLFRPPTSHDARAMRFLARDSQVLSVNSTYFYALMARHFSATCLVAEDAGGVCGYVIGYCPPEQPDTLFVWQVGVAKSCQGKGLGKRLLMALLKQAGPVFLEASIAPSNQASINLFRALARHFEVSHTFSEAPYFSAADLGEEEEAEHLMRLGPFSQ
ncbi:MAG: diaminobutyrate acetyltransferase [Desulfurivibrionaceae bacterium]|nr:diaminobutyrate acetyltransferase [Desulfurivibrionaceae bacterium]